MLALLGLPTFALALSITVVTTYVPVVAEGLGSSTTLIGLLIAVEGLMALLLPVLVGAWSDTLRTRIGGRLPFLLAAAPVAAIGLVGFGLVGSVGLLAVCAALFFAAYFVAYEPYRALYPDLLDDEVAGRGQSTQALWRGVGTGLALLGGGLLLTLGTAVPFAVCAAILLATTAAFVRLVVRRGVPDRPAPDAGVREALASMRGTVRRSRALRAFLVANALWELALGALKTFVVLWLTRGMGFGTGEAALAVGGVSLLVVGAAAASGPLADRLGAARLMALVLPVSAIGFLVPGLTTSTWLIVAALPFVALGGGVVMSLPYALVIPLMDDDERGTLTGLYSMSRGVGTALGPLLAGVAITTLAGPLGSTEGYAATWLVCAAATALSIWPLRVMRREQTREP